MQENLYHLSVQQPADSLSLATGYTKVLNQVTDLVLRTALPMTSVLGEQQIKPQQQVIKKQLEQLMAAMTAGIDSESAEGKQVRAWTRSLLEVFLDKTEFKALQKESYLNIVALSVLLARCPELIAQFEINVGFGGSDSTDVNLRVPAYVVPALRVMENFKQFLIKNKLPVTLPRLRIFFAPHSAIAVNGAAMAAAGVLENQARTQNYLAKYIEQFHPDLIPYIYFEVEQPWEDHSAATQTVLNTYSHVLQSSPEPGVIQALDTLRARGGNHGSHNGQELAHVYAAIHPLLFKDGLNHPPVTIFDNEQKPLLSLSIGGRPERLFNSIRTHLRHKFSPSMLEDLNNNGHAAHPEFTLEDWLRFLGEAHGTDLEELGYVFRPYIAALAVTKVGSQPVYYHTESDQGLDSLSELPSVFFEQQEALIAEGDLTSQEKSLANKRLREIAEDMRILYSDTGTEQEFIDFVSNADL